MSIKTRWTAQTKEKCSIEHEYVDDYLKEISQKFSLQDASTIELFISRILDLEETLEQIRDLYLVDNLSDEEIMLQMRDIAIGAIGDAD